MKDESNELEKKLAALTGAVCDILASVASDNAILRDLLSKKVLVTDIEFNRALQEFRETDGWTRYRDQMSRRIAELAQAKMDSGDGPVN
jgi:hypothetical protein